MINSLGFSNLINMDDLLKYSDQDHNKKISFDEFLGIMNKDICLYDGEKDMQ